MEKIGSWRNPFWPEAYHWGCTSEQHIWECVETGLYHYSDECSQFDIYGYKSIEDCKLALGLYAASL